MSDQGHGNNLEAWNHQLFGVQRSIRYHARRQAFYDFWNTLTNATSIILGAGTVAALVNTSSFAMELRLWFPVVITLVSTLNLVWGTARAARLHNDLYRRFVALEQEITSAAQIDDATLRAFQTKRLTIEADEPPTKFAVDVLCHNELARAIGSNDYYQVRFWQRWFAHLFSFSSAKFPHIKKVTA
jgi:hypothetical protein